MITKKRKLINEKIDKEKLYSADEALALVKETPLATKAPASKET